MKIKLLIILCLLLIGCTEPEIIDEESTPESAEIKKQTGSSEVEEVVEESVPEEIVVNKTCTQDLECTGTERCIDGTCGLLNAINNQECVSKCTYKSANIETSDGDILTLKRGESTYTAAGAVAWKLLNPGEYCPGEDVRIPIQIEKVNYGKILSTQVLTTKINEVSEEVNHPTVKSVKFTLKVVDLEEECV
tara:strand:+ start:213 stop:788 length:576 start_codon:yes stop_codon:yes gene_type:complete